MKIGLPKSMQIAQTLEQEIRSGGLSKGDQLASENELVRRFSVSRNTVRKGLEQLTRQGLITTRTGVGSFVTYDGASIDNSLGWTLALSQADQIETRILKVQRGKSRLAGKALDMSDVDFLHVDRLRVISSSGVSISLERSRLPWRPAFATVLEKGLANKSLSDTLSYSGLVVNHGEEWAKVLPSLSEADAELMQRTPGEPMLRLRRITRDAAGEVIEFVESTLDPMRFGLHLEF